MRLRIRLLMLIAPCLALLLVASTAKTKNNFLRPNASTAKLQLTTRVLEQRSCSADELGLKLRLTVRNVGDQPVILNRGTDISRIMVSATIAAANDRRYEQELRYDDPGADIGLNDPALSEFTIIRPAEVFEFDRTISVYLFRQDRRAEAFLTSGSHFLQVEVGTWPYIAEPVSFAQKWKDQGDLFFAGLTSEPMAFTIEKSIRIVKCA